MLNDLAVKAKPSNNASSNLSLGSTGSALDLLDFIQEEKLTSSCHTIENGAQPLTKSLSEGDLTSDSRIRKAARDFMVKKGLLSFVGDLLENALTSGNEDCSSLVTSAYSLISFLAKDSEAFSTQGVEKARSTRINLREKAVSGLHRDNADLKLKLVESKLTTGLFGKEGVEKTVDAMSKTALRVLKSHNPGVNFAQKRSRNGLQHALKPHFDYQSAFKRARWVNLNQNQSLNQRGIASNREGLNGSYPSLGGSNPYRKWNFTPYQQRNFTPSTNFLALSPPNNHRKPQTQTKPRPQGQATHSHQQDERSHPNVALPFPKQKSHVQSSFRHGKSSGTRYNQNRPKDSSAFPQKRSSRYAGKKDNRSGSGNTQK